MFLTEEQALKKECCGPAVLYQKERDVFCHASACMGWRWIDKPSGNPIYKSKKPGSEVDHYEPRRGFCGLAGHPGQEGSRS